MSGGAYSLANIRAGLKSFALGKVVTAPMSFVVVLLLAAHMVKEEYASYVSATAILEIGTMVARCGIDWLIQTTIATIRVRGTPGELRRAIIVLGCLQAVPQMLIALGIGLCAPLIASLLSNVVTADVLRLYAIVLAIEGPARMVRDHVLGVLMVQGAVQISQIVRVLTLFACVGSLIVSGMPVTADHVAVSEIGASAISLLVALRALLPYLSRSRIGNETNVSISKYLGKDSFRFAANAYFSFMFTILLSAEVTTAFVARYLGTDATAIFGFLTKLIDTGRRFLPMDLFYAVILPATIGRFESSGRDFGNLMRDANLMLKANLVVLSAGMAVALGIGDDLVRWLSRGNVQPPPFMLAALLATAYGHSLRRVVELVAFVIGRSKIFLYGSFSVMLTPIAFVVLFGLYKHLYVVAGVLCFIDLLFSSLVIWALRRENGRLGFDWQNGAKLCVCSILGGTAGALIDHFSASMYGMIAASAASLAVFAIMLFASRVVGMVDITYAVSLVKSKARPAAQ